MRSHTRKRDTNSYQVVTYEARGKGGGWRLCQRLSLPEPQLLSGRMRGSCKAILFLFADLLDLSGVFDACRAAQQKIDRSQGSGLARADASSCERLFMRIKT